MPFTDGTPAPNDAYRIEQGLEPLVFDKATGRQVNLVNRNGVWVDPAGAQKMVGNPNNTPITGLAQQTYDQGGDLAAMAARTREPGYGMPSANIMNQTPNPTNVSELAPGSAGSILKSAPPIGPGPQSIPGPMVNSAFTDSRAATQQPSVNQTAAPRPQAPPPQRAAPRPTGASNFASAFSRARERRAAKRSPSASQY